MRKLIIKLVLALFLLIIIAIGIAWAFVDTLAEKGIEAGATYALGVDTKVDDVDLSLLKGSLELKGLNIANPPKFTTPHLMNMGQLETELVIKSLMGDTVEVTKFEIHDLDVNIETDPGAPLETNVTRIMQNLEKLSSGEKKPSEEGAGGKKVKIDRIVITNVVAHFSLGVGGSEGQGGVLGGVLEKVNKVVPTNTTVEIPDIVLTDVTSDNAGGVVVSELTAKVITAILEAVLKEAETKLPAGASLIMEKLNETVSAQSKALGIGEGLKISDK